LSKIAKIKYINPVKRFVGSFLSQAIASSKNRRFFKLYPILNTVKNYTLISDNDADGLSASKLIVASYGPPAKLYMSHAFDLVNEVAHKIRGKEVIVLDKSTIECREGLDILIDNRNRVRWFDHHMAGEGIDKLPAEFFINYAENYSTVRVVSEHCDVPFANEWAVMGLYGDQRLKVAEEASAQLGVTSLNECKRLAQLTNFSTKFSMRDARDLLGVLSRSQRPADALRTKEYEMIEKVYSAAEAKLDRSVLQPEEVLPNIYLLDFSAQPESLYWDIGKEVFEKLAIEGAETLILHTTRLHTVMDANNAGPVATKLGGGGRKFAGGFPFKGSFEELKSFTAERLA